MDPFSRIWCWINTDANPKPLASPHGNYHSLEQFFRTIKRVAKLDATLNMPCLTIGSLFPFVAPAVAMDCAMVTNVGPL